MIEPETTIRFSTDDVPDLPEMHKPKRWQRKKREIPEPEDWRPIGAEW